MVPRTLTYSMCIGTLSYWSLAEEMKRRRRSRRLSTPHLLWRTCDAETQLHCALRVTDRRRTATQSDDCRSSRVVIDTIKSLAGLQTLLALLRQPVFPPKRCSMCYGPLNFSWCLCSIACSNCASRTGQVATQHRSAIHCRSALSQ